MHAGTIIHLRGFPCRLNKVIYIGCLAHSGKLLKQILLLSLSLLFSLFIHSFTHSTRVEPRHVPALGWLLLVHSHPIPLHTPCCSVLCPRSLTTTDCITQAPVPSGFQLETLAGNLRVGGERSWTIYPAFHFLPVSTWGW